MEQKLYRDEHRKMISGVCAGLADYFNVDPTIVRLLFAFTFFIMGFSIIAYIVLWIVMPPRYYNPFTTPADPLTVDYMVPPVQPDTPFTNMPPKRKSNGGLICGVILIIIGSIFLLNEYDIIPDWDYGKLWPVILIAVGASLILSGQQKKPWDHQDWNKTGHTGGSVNSPIDNPPTV